MPQSAIASLIRRIEVFLVPIRLREPFRIALQTISTAENVFVRLTDAAGRTGWGEVSPLHAVTGETPGTCIAASELLGGVVLGRDERELRALAAEMANVLPHNTGIRSAFDMALHDLAAQTAGMPLYRFLGGSPREIRTDLTLGIAGVEATVKAGLSAVGMGFSNLKVKIGLDFERDLAAVSALREALGPRVTFRLDANQAWSRQEALERLGRLAKHDIQFCEQPIYKADVEGLIWLSDRSPIPVMADESVFAPEDVLRLRSMPYINLKVAKAGGIRPLLDSDTLAHTCGINTMLGCMMESRLGLTASAHAALAGSSFRFFDLDTHFDLAEDPIEGGIQYEGDAITLPETPGLGASVKPEFLVHGPVLDLP